MGQWVKQLKYIKRASCQIVYLHVQTPKYDSIGLAHPQVKGTGQRFCKTCEREQSKTWQRGQINLQRYQRFSHFIESTTTMDGSQPGCRTYNMFELKKHATVTVPSDHVATNW